MTARILVAGIGNIFLGDDGFGSEVVRNADIPQNNPSVRIIDYGIRGMHLAYDLLEEWDTLVLVDAVPSRGNPGTLHVFQADYDQNPAVEHESGFSTTGLDAHSMDPAAVFASLRALGGSPPYTVVVGCEAGSVEEGIGLTEPVAMAVPRAARAVEEIVAALQTPTAATARVSLFEEC
ncbi:MAG: hydrogenase maturation protease [Mycobacterium sp.]